MKLALVFGKAQGDVLKSRLSNVKDNAEIDCYTSIKDFINGARIRNCVYNRILIVSTIIKDNDIKELHSFWRVESRDSEIVVIARKDVDFDLVKSFLSLFSTTSVTGMLVTSTPIQVMVDAAFSPLRYINEKYSVPDFLNVEIDDGVSVAGFEEKINKDEEQPKEEKPKVEEPKKSFISALFGKKDKKKPVNKLIDTPKVEESIEEEKTEKDEMPDLDTESLASDIVSSTKEAEIVDELVNNEDFVDEASDSDTFSESFSTPIDEDELGETNIPTHFEENFEFSVNHSSLINEEEVNEDFYEEEEEEEKNFEDEDQDRYINDSIKADDFEFNESLSDESSYEEPELVEEPLHDENNYEEQESVDADLGDVVVDYEAKETKTEPLEDDSPVEEDMGSVQIAGDEESYRQTTEKPKVVIQTVTKEIIRNKGAVATTALDNIYSGRAKKIIVVTGDRGTGVTSTALNLAMSFSKRVPVLYYDCDIENHGLLNYIDYDEYRKYGTNAINGLKMCRNISSFQSARACLDNNLDILSTDFTCDATDEDIQKSQGVVAEVMDNYGVIIVDCPVSHLSSIQDLVLLGTTVICVEGTKRGFMNMLCQFEASVLPIRYKRLIASKGNIFVTKAGKTDLKKLLKHLRLIFVADTVDWLAIPCTEFNGKLTDGLLNMLVEG